MRIKKLYCVVLVFAFMICGTLAYSTSVSAATNPIAEWKMDEESGAIVPDSSGQVKNGTVIGATWVVDGGIIGNALNFVGSTSYVTAPPSVDRLANWSIEAWVKPVDGSGDYYIYFERNPVVNFYVSITENNSIKVETRNRFRDEGSESDGYTTVDGVITRNAWNYVVVTLEGGTDALDSGTVTCYVNGEIAGTPGALGRSKAEIIAGAEWTVGQSTVLTRINDTAEIAAGAGGVEDFNNIYPWSEMKLCNVANDGTISEGVLDRSGDSGQVMVKIPKFYYKHTYGDYKHTFEIASGPVDGFKLHPAFVRDGKEKPCVFVGAYEGYVEDGKLGSKTGVNPTTSKTIEEFRNCAHARNVTEGDVYWEQIDVQTYSAIQLLYLVEYANTNCQAMIGKGVSNGGSCVATGGCDDLNGVSNIASEFNDPVNYRGIENIWGNVYSWIDGVNIKNDERQPYIADHDYVSQEVTGDYIATEVILPEENGYFKEIAYSETADWLIMPSSVGSELSYIPDYFNCYWPNENNKLVLACGSWLENDHAGLFHWCVNTSGGSRDNFGSRALAIPSN
ncbi:MAG: hypothetical protein PHI90_04785 [Clostridia bacterium]|nr:hypothetical protein [Clostridia bacterium]